MAKLMDYLEWHGNQLRVRMKVPTDLRRVFGKTMLRRPLHTSDLAEANRLKKPVIADMEDRFKQARKALANTDPITAEALQHRLLMTSGKPSPVQLAERREALFGPPDADREVSTEEMAFLVLVHPAALNAGVLRLSISEVDPVPSPEGRLIGQLPEPDRVEPLPVSIFRHARAADSLLMLSARVRKCFHQHHYAGALHGAVRIFRDHRHTVQTTQGLGPRAFQQQCCDGKS